MPSDGEAFQKGVTLPQLAPVLEWSPYPSELMQARAVSKLVNNPRNEGAAILA